MVQGHLPHHHHLPRGHKVPRHQRVGDQSACGQIGEVYAVHTGGGVQAEVAEGAAGGVAEEEPGGAAAGQLETDRGAAAQDGVRGVLVELVAVGSGSVATEAEVEGVPPAVVVYAFAEDERVGER